jgi:tetratricopeptide (TPR) repeat protein
MDEQEKYTLLAQVTASMMQEPDMPAQRRAQLLLERAEIYTALNNPAKALDDLDEAISLNDSLAGAYMLRGRLRFGLRDKNAAFEDLRRAAQLDPSLLDSISGEYKTPGAPKAFKLPKD